MSETSSSVWKFFKKVNDDGSICQICMRTAKNKGGNTSNLAMHLRRNHPMQYATINPKRKVNSQASKETDETVGFPSSAPKKVKLSLGALTSLKRPQQPTPAQSPRDRLSKEIKLYQTYPVIDGDEDPLKWWQRNKVDFPLFCQLARKYLAIQASSSPSERLFSKAGLISTPSRAQLKPEKVDMLTFLAENL